MLRPSTVALFGAVLGIAVCAAACRATPTDERRAQWARGGGIHRELREYLVIDSVHSGKVGYLKVYDVTEFGGPPYRWSYVYDTDWHELGFVNQFGGATMYHYYSPAERAQQDKPLRATQLPSDSLQRNILRMLGRDPATDDVTFHPATKADITGDTGTNLAGPGVAPAPGPTAPQPAAKPAEAPKK